MDCAGVDARRNSPRDVVYVLKSFPGWSIDLQREVVALATENGGKVWVKRRERELAHVLVEERY